MNLDTVIDALIIGFDMRSEIDRRKAFVKCVEYADGNFTADQYTPFLLRAAERLGQSRLLKAALSSAARLDGKERLHIRFDEMEGVQIVGNPSGLLFLSRVLRGLSQGKQPGEHVYLNYAERPLVGESYPAAIYLEDDPWFDDLDTTTIPEDELVVRDIKPADIAGFYILDYPPQGCDIEPGKLYTALSCTPYMPGIMAWMKDIRDDLSRMVVVEYITPGGTRQCVALDLDDPDVGFVTYTDISDMLRTGRRQK